MLTSPCNRWRDNVRCPMGCRVARARRERSRLSKKYYSTPEGRQKKRGLNSKRGRAEPVVASPAPEESAEDSVASYLKSILSMIEGRKISTPEIKGHMERWDEELRQYRLVEIKKPAKLPDE